LHKTSIARSNMSAHCFYSPQIPVPCIESKGEMEEANSTILVASTFFHLFSYILFNFMFFGEFYLLPIACIL
jgi:hypothetical protein